MSGPSPRFVNRGEGGEALPRKGIPLRAYENNQFRSRLSGNANGESDAVRGVTAFSCAANGHLSYAVNRFCGGAVRPHVRVSVK
jgi:hypothetical protein